LTGSRGFFAFVRRNLAKIARSDGEKNRALPQENGFL
jgi:hypothetical protein